MPLTLLEAMSYGNCCLVSDIAECTEVLGDQGMTFKQSDIRELQEKLQKVCEDPEIVDRYKTKAAEYVLKKYDWDRIAEKTLELYRG